MFFDLNKIFSKNLKTDVQTETPKVKIVVVAFEDDCSENSGKILAQYLAEVDFLTVQYYENSAKDVFASLNGRNFFDFVDCGKQILYTTEAEVLIRGVREKDKVRLIFQTVNQYDKLNYPMFSLLNSLCLPLSYFQQQELPVSMISLIAGAVLAASAIKQNKKQKILAKVVESISKTKSPQGLEIVYMPYILNVLALIYLCLKFDSLKLQDVRLISDLLKNAYRYQPASKDVLLIGCVYANLGQLYQFAAENLGRYKYIFYKNAVECCRYAQKYFNRYSYPYDFGALSYRLSKIYYGYWKQSSDVQALRDAVFHLREAEKVFSQASFPYFWAAIQGDLGLYLSLLGLFSSNDEISMLAVNNYKNRQKVYIKEQKPLEWAKAEESIGNIFYNSGKKHDDEEYLEEAIKYYTRAAEIYENGKMSVELKQMQICIAKADEYIMQLNRK